MDGSGDVDIVAGGYADWERQRAPVREGAKGGRKVAAQIPSRSRVKLTYKDQRDLEQLPAEIEKIEASIARDEAELASPDLYTRDPKRFDALMIGLETARRRKEEAELRWLELAEMAENLG
jgi:ATP-binding cassette subfamily F protein uup